MDHRLTRDQLLYCTAGVFGKGTRVNRYHYLSNLQISFEPGHLILNVGGISDVVFIVH